MKYRIITVLSLWIFLLVHTSSAQEHPFGLGVVIGEPAGISSILWTSPVTAIDGGIGFSIGGDRIGNFDSYYDGVNRVHIHMDYLWYSFNVITSSERFPLYCGMGIRMNAGAGSTVSSSVRGVIGMTWLPREVPIDIFWEFVPMYQFTFSKGFGIDAGVGARYFF